MDTSKIYPKRDDANDGTKLLPHKVDMVFIREALLERSYIAGESITIPTPNATWHSASEMNDIRSKLVSLKSSLTADYISELPTINSASGWLDDATDSYPMFSSINYVTRALTTTSGMFDYLTSGVEKGKPIKDAHIRTLYWDLFGRGTAIDKVLFPSESANGTYYVKKYDYEYKYEEFDVTDPETGVATREDKKTETPEDERQTEDEPKEQSSDLFTGLNLSVNASSFDESQPDSGSGSFYAQTTRTREITIYLSTPHGSINIGSSFSKMLENSLISKIYVYIMFHCQKNFTNKDGVFITQHKYIPYEISFDNFTDGSISYSWTGIPADVMTTAFGFSSVNNTEDSCENVCDLSENTYIGDYSGSSKSVFLSVGVSQVKYIAELNLSTSIEKIGWANASAP